MEVSTAKVGPSFFIFIFFLKIFCRFKILNRSCDFFPFLFVYLSSWPPNRKLFRPGCQILQQFLSYHREAQHHPAETRPRPANIRKRAALQNHVPGESARRRIHGRSPHVLQTPLQGHQLHQLLRQLCGRHGQPKDLRRFWQQSDLSRIYDWVLLKLEIWSVVFFLLCFYTKHERHQMTEMTKKLEGRLLFQRRAWFIQSAFGENGNHRDSEGFVQFDYCVVFWDRPLKKIPADQFLWQFWSKSSICTCVFSVCAQLFKI